MNHSHLIQRRQFLQLSSLALGGGLLSACNSQNSEPQLSENSDKNLDKNLDSVRFALNWKAEAEYGGFYQAVATGIYQDYGIDVTIRPINPQTNSTQLLVGGAVDLNMGGSLNTIKAIEQGIPIVTVASIFQKDIQILLSHPDVGNDSLQDLKGKPIFISPGSQLSFWLLLKAKYGLKDDQIRQYNFNITPFLVDEQSTQQGILTSEPYSIEKEGGFKPVIHFLQQSGYNPYSFTIKTTQKLVNTNPDLVDRFVDASIMGWYSYLENPEPGNQLIKQDNPEMTDDLIAYGLNKLKEYGAIISGDAEFLGIGAMTDERWHEFFQNMVEVGVFDRTLDYRKAYTLDFVNKGVEYYQSHLQNISKTRL